jgi:hypothetical protein
MATNVCPACGQPIATQDINIGQGVALCRSCGTLSRLADVVDQSAGGQVSITSPPSGCDYEDQIGGGVIISAAHRAIGSALGVLVFCLFWNGIVSIFVLFAIAGVYTHFFGPLPAWFPVPRGSGHKGGPGPDMPWGTTLFLCIFLIPFVTIGLAYIFIFLTLLLGRVKVIVEGDDGRIRTGFGPFKWTRRFDASAVTRVTAGQTKYMVNNQTRPLIILEADRTIKFGSMLPNERREWMLGALRMRLIHQRAKASRGNSGR